MVAITLPEDVLETLRGLHPDPGWAIVQLVERTHPTQPRHPHPRETVAELARLPGKRALIVVKPQSLGSLPGVSLIPLSDGRAFLALAPGAGIADLEVAVLDRVDELPRNSLERRPLMEFRKLIRKWRRDSGLRIRSQALILIEGTVAETSQVLSRLPDSPRR